MATDSREYKAHKKQFDLELLEAEKHMNDEMTPEEILKAQKDQQLLTKLVEKSILLLRIMQKMQNSQHRHL